MTRAWGVANAYGNLKTVLMHRPGVELDMVTPNTLAEFHFDEPVERAAFVREYDTMVETFRSDGVECLFLTDLLKDDDDALGYIARRPNMTYTRDLAAVFRRGAVLMSPHLRGRWGDQHMMERAFRRLGIPILGAIECPAFLEGGGVTFVGDDTVVASVCDRANQAGTARLRELVLGSQTEYFLEVPLPFGHIHIDGLFLTLDDQLAIMHSESFAVFPCRLFEHGRSEPRHLMFEEFLDERGIEKIVITDDERLGGHLNLVVTERARRAIGFEAAERLGQEMANRGWKLSTFPAETLFKGNGGAHCMTCPIHIA